MPSHKGNAVEDMTRDDVRNNIKLPYAVRIHDIMDNAVYVGVKNAEFFVDEHGFQWVKFTPKNGYAANKLHMRRTENLMIIKQEG